MEGTAANATAQHRARSAPSATAPHIHSPHRRSDPLNPRLNPRHTPKNAVPAHNYPTAQNRTKRLGPCRALTSATKAPILARPGVHSVHPSPSRNPRRATHYRTPRRPNLLQRCTVDLCPAATRRATPDARAAPLFVPASPLPPFASFASFSPHSPILPSPKTRIAPDPTPATIPPMSDTPRSIRARVPGSEYDILVHPGLLSSAGRHLRRLTASQKAIIITDDHVAPLHLPTLTTSLHFSGFQVTSTTLPPGEDHKTIASAARLYDQILPAGIDRSTPLLALGGGVIGDLAGFVAATTLRGLPFVQVPTTLLSMVDASVGGKTGVNHPTGKNLIGSFHQPMLVLIDTATLRTLPPRELRGGLAECIKHDIIRDPEGFTRLEQSIHRALALDLPYLTDLVAHNVAIKARVVEADPFEKAERAHLNFGHTFGHAIESVSRYAYSHGECVALGMVAASRLAVRLGLLDQPSCDRITRLIAATGLPTGGVTLPTDDILHAMLFDKKVKSGKVRFVLPDRIGHVIIRDDVPPDTVRDVVESLR